MNILFMGGSITCGASSSSYENSWASQISEFLSTTLIGLELNFYNAAIPGTGTQLGVFRLKEHVLKLKPDVIFIEYAVNDSGDALKDKDKVISALDYIVRTLIQSNPSIKIILLYSAMRDWKACSAVHERVALHYEIPSIDIQAHVKALIEQGEHTWEELFVDQVHPNDQGHKLYADYIKDVLERDWDMFFAGGHPLNRSLSSYKYCFPRLVGIDCVEESEGWIIKHIDDTGKHMVEIRIETALCAATPGSSFTLRFFGSHFGLYHRVGSDCGICSIQIDDEPATKLDFYYDTAGDFVAFYTRNDLNIGTHRIQLKMLDEKNPKSSGNNAAIAGFLVD